jgi:hypothetical protein
VEGKAIIILDEEGVTNGHLKNKEDGGRAGEAFLCRVLYITARHVTGNGNWIPLGEPLQALSGNWRVNNGLQSFFLVSFSFFLFSFSQPLASYPDPGSGFGFGFGFFFASSYFHFPFPSLGRALGRFLRFRGFKVSLSRPHCSGLGNMGHMGVEHFLYSPRPLYFGGGDITRGAWLEKAK